MMDVFVGWQMTLTTDGDYTSTLFFLFPLLQENDAEQLSEIQSKC